MFSRFSFILSVLILSLLFTMTIFCSNAEARNRYKYAMASYPKNYVNVNYGYRQHKPHKHHCPKYNYGNSYGNRYNYANSYGTYTVNNIPSVQAVNSYTRLWANNVYRGRPELYQIYQNNYNDPVQTGNTNPYFNRSRANPYFNR